MKIRVEENVYNGNISYQVVPRKYNEDKEEGLKGKEILILKSKFDSNNGVSVRKKDTKFAKAGSKFNWGFVKCEWLNMPPEYEKYLDDYQSITISYGGINSIQDFKDRHIPQESLFYIVSMPFIGRDDKPQKAITLGEIKPLSVNQYKIAVAARNQNLGYFEEIVVRDDAGVTQTKKLSEVIPFWALCVSDELLQSNTNQDV